MSGRHRKSEEEVPVAFEDIVRGVELSNEVLCESCEERPPILRAKPCGEDEFSLLCPLCMQVIMLRMSLTVAESMCQGAMTLCGPCQKPIPDLPSLANHIEILPMDLRGLEAA